MAGEGVGALERQNKVEQRQQGIDFGTLQGVPYIKAPGLEWSVYVTTGLETDVIGLLGKR